MNASPLGALWASLIVTFLCSGQAGADTTDAPGLRFYAGRIDGRLDFRMTLLEPTQPGRPCEGSYVYAGKRQAIALSGECSAARLQLTEPPAGAPKVNRITAEAKDGGFRGNWESADGRRQLSFEARELRPERRAVLADAIGRYRLANISGFFGANSMSEIWRTGRSWQANMSSISQGTREGSEVELNREQLRLLNSLELRVDADLNIEVRGPDRPLALFPFGELPMFTVEHMPRDDDHRRVFERDTRLSFVDRQLRVATTDIVDASPFVGFENMPIDTSVPVALGLDYDPIGLQFSLELIPDGCCDRVTLTFRRER